MAGDRLILFHRVNNRETVEAMDANTGKTIWTFDYPTSYRDDFGFDEGPRAVPVIAGGRVFTHGADGMLHGIDFASGKMLWSVDTRKVFEAPKGYFGVASSPVVDGTSRPRQRRRQGGRDRRLRRGERKDVVDRDVG